MGYVSEGSKGGEGSSSCPIDNGDADGGTDDDKDSDLISIDGVGDIDGDTCDGDSDRFYTLLICYAGWRWRKWYTRDDGAEDSVDESGWVCV